jgi:hypothetical protein
VAVASTCGWRRLATPCTMMQVVSAAAAAAAALSHCCCERRRRWLKVFIICSRHVYQHNRRSLHPPMCEQFEEHACNQHLTSKTSAKHQNFVAQATAPPMYVDQRDRSCTASSAHLLHLVSAPIPLEAQLATVAVRRCGPIDGHWAALQSLAPAAPGVLLPPPVRPCFSRPAMCLTAGIREKGLKACHSVNFFAESRLSLPGRQRISWHAWHACT